MVVAIMTRSSMTKTFSLFFYLDEYMHACTIKSLQYLDINLLEICKTYDKTIYNNSVINM